ncbi:HipA domain-containing protein [Arenimonas terrae]|uniref:Uncharacterized protein n=1 Tax=Arenimonas terrae TaxID=2546226 RepID=A0A5C4RXN6_9GAMM|nr:HipA domain-containing protein [Arenimonas terrae]TNJ35709.1 hypothetical protein E1B00_08180 [Arenimonas terrae]
MFPVVQVPSREAGIFEPLGTKAKFWFDDNRSLFKEGRVGTGENWAEVVCAELAELLGLPHASYRLAEFVDQGHVRRGVSTPNFVPTNARLVLGNELIKPVASFETAVRQIRRQEHTIRRIATVMKMSSLLPPLDWTPPSGVEGAGGTMAGYLLLDALVANQDRHEENWGLVVRDGRLYLAPTFDHASSLGRNERDEVRRKKLDATASDHSVVGYARRARSQIFSSDGARLTTHDAFRHISAIFPSGAQFWLDRLGTLSEASFRDVLNQVPNDWISETAREFAVQMLVTNRLALLEK